MEGFLMFDGAEICLTLWAKVGNDEEAVVPADCVVVCPYEDNFGIVDIQEMAHFRRTEQRDELRISNHFARWLAAWRLSKYDIATSALAMVRALIRSRVGSSWPSRFVRQNLTSSEHFDDLLAGIKAALDANREAAAKRWSKIVETAEQGLSPTPSFTDARFWEAKCPGTNHSLPLNTVINKFFCGWCKRSRGPNELAAVVAERAKSRTGTAAAIISPRRQTARSDSPQLTQRLVDRSPFGESARRKDCDRAHERGPLAAVGADQAACRSPLDQIGNWTC
jgi:hypothetical protein